MSNAENLNEKLDAAIAQAVSDKLASLNSGFNTLIAGVIYAANNGATATAVKLVRGKIENAFPGTYGREITGKLGYVAEKFGATIQHNLTQSWSDQIAALRAAIEQACTDAGLPVGLAGVAKMKNPPKERETRSMFESAESFKERKKAEKEKTESSDVRDVPIEAPTRELVAADVLLAYQTLSGESQQEFLELLAAAGAVKIAKPRQRKAS